jgi:hypothetical protein
MPDHQDGQVAPFSALLTEVKGSHHCSSVHFSPEDGDRMFLRNVGIYRRVHTAPKPRRTTSSLNMTIFWDVTPCSLVDTDRCLRGAYCLHHQGDCSETSVSIYQTTWCYMQKTAVFILVAVRTSNLTQIKLLPRAGGGGGGHKRCVNDTGLTYRQI